MLDRRILYQLLWPGSSGPLPSFSPLYILPDIQMLSVKPVQQKHVHFLCTCANKGTDRSQPCYPPNMTGGAART